MFLEEITFSSEEPYIIFADTNWGYLKGMEYVVLVFITLELAWRPWLHPI